jgi:hypothetical protein
LNAMTSRQLVDFVERGHFFAACLRISVDPYAALPVFLAGSVPASAFGNNLDVNADANRDGGYSGTIYWGKDGNKSETFDLKPLKIVS